MAAPTEYLKVTVDFPSTAAGKVSIVNIDLIPFFGAGYIAPPCAVEVCYPPLTPNTFSLEARVVEPNVLRVGLRNNNSTTLNPGPTEIKFIIFTPS